jgi:hypothetical protein
MNPDREAERRYAERRSYFWLPCPVCEQPFGGHEHEQHRSPHRDSIPVSLTTVSASGRGICPECTDRGVGCRAWAEAEGAMWIPPHRCEFLPPGLIVQGPPYRAELVGLSTGRTADFRSSDPIVIQPPDPIVVQPLNSFSMPGEVAEVFEVPSTLRFEVPNDTVSRWMLR